MKENLKDLSRAELERLVISCGHASYRAGQVFRWMYKKFSADIDAMKDVPLALRKKLAKKFYISSPRLLDSKVSKIDRTAKYLLKLGDSNIIEAVYLPEEERATVCISSQVGCKHSCSFCASSVLGFVRNLQPSEILDEVIFVKRSGLPVTNVVFMGIGEPFDNYGNVIKSIRILNDPDGMNIGARRMTVSTCGLIPGIERFSGEGLQVELSVSLHSPNDRIRSKLVPINKKYPIRDLIGACKRYIDKTNRVITFEYVLISGMNSSRADARNLAALLKGMKCKVNLIAYNQIKALGHEAPSAEASRAFLEELRLRGTNATLRRSRGEDIDAGCGQLRISRINVPPSP